MSARIISFSGGNRDLSWQQVPTHSNHVVGGAAYASRLHGLCPPKIAGSLYGHTVVPRLKTVESHVIVPTSTPSNVARAPKRRSTSTPFPGMADGFDGMEMNVRTPAPFVVRTPVPLFLTVNPPTSRAVPSKPKSRPTTLFSITNVPTPSGLMILPVPTRIPRGLSPFLPLQVRTHARRHDQKECPSGYPSADSRYGSLEQIDCRPCGDPVEVALDAARDLVV
jgi:hypothetical protein